MKTKREMPMSEALDEIVSVAQQLKGEGATKLNGREIKAEDPVTLEIETESGKKGAEVEFEIKWPAERMTAKSPGKTKRGGGFRWLFLALTGAAVAAAAFFFARQRRGSRMEEDEFEPVRGY